MTFTTRSKSNAATCMWGCCFELKDYGIYFLQSKRIKPVMVSRLTHLTPEALYRVQGTDHTFNFSNMLNDDLACIFFD